MLRCIIPLQCPLLRCHFLMPRQLASPAANDPGSATSPAAMSPAVTMAPATPSPPVQPVPAHPMLTRAKAGIHKPNPRYTLSADSSPPSSSTAAISPIPSSAHAALRDPNWHAAMEAEFHALQSNQTWRLVDRPPGAHIISGKWVFTHELRPDWSLDRYKACWVVRGFTQRAGVDFGKTFTPIVKPATIRTVLTIAASWRWPTRQLDVSNAFLHDVKRDVTKFSRISHKEALFGASVSSHHPSVSSVA